MRRTITAEILVRPPVLGTLLQRLRDCCRQYRLVSSDPEFASVWNGSHCSRNPKAWTPSVQAFVKFLDSPLIKTVPIDDAQRGKNQYAGRFDTLVKLTRQFTNDLYSGKPAQILTLPEDPNSSLDVFVAPPILENFISRITTILDYGDSVVSRLLSRCVEKTSRPVSLDEFEGFVVEGTVFRNSYYVFESPIYDFVSLLEKISTYTDQRGKPIFYLDMNQPEKEMMADQWLPDLISLSTKASRKMEMFEILARSLRDGVEEEESEGENVRRRTSAHHEEEIVRLRAECDRAVAERASMQILKDQLESAGATTESLQTQLMRKEEEVERLSNQLSEQEELANTFQGQVEELDRSNEELKKELDTLREEKTGVEERLDQVRVASAEKIRVLKGSLLQTNKISRSREARICDLETEKAELIVEKEDVEEQVRQSEANLRETIQRSDEAIEQVKQEKDAVIEEVRQQLRNTVSDLDDERAVLAEAERQIRRRVATYQQAVENVAQGQTQAACETILEEEEMGEDLRRLNAPVVQFLTAISDRENIIEDRERTIERIKLRNKNLLKKVGQQSNEIESLSGKLTQSEEEVTIMEQEARDRGEVIDGMKNDIDSLNSTLREREGDIQLLEVKNKSLEDEVERLGGVVDDQDGTIAEHEDTIKTRLAEIERLKRVNQDQASTITDHERTIRQHEEEEERLRGVIEDQKEEIANQKAAIAARNGKITDLEDDRASLEDELSRTRTWVNLRMNSCRKLLEHLQRKHKIMAQPKTRGPTISMQLYRNFGEEWIGSPDGHVSFGEDLRVVLVNCEENDRVRVLQKNCPPMMAAARKDGYHFKASSEEIEIQVLPANSEDIVYSREISCQNRVWDEAESTFGVLSKWKSGSTVSFRMELKDAVRRDVVPRIVSVMSIDSSLSFIPDSVGIGDFEFKNAVVGSYVVIVNGKRTPLVFDVVPRMLDDAKSEGRCLRGARYPRDEGHFQVELLDDESHPASIHTIGIDGMNIEFETLSPNVATFSWTPLQSGKFVIYANGIAIGEVVVESETLSLLSPENSSFIVQTTENVFVGQLLEIDLRLHNRVGEPLHVSADEVKLRITPDDGDGIPRECVPVDGPDATDKVWFRLDCSGSGILVVQGFSLDHDPIKVEGLFPSVEYSSCSTTHLQEFCFGEVCGTFKDQTDTEIDVMHLAMVHRETREEFEIFVVDSESARWNGSCRWEPQLSGDFHLQVNGTLFGEKVINVHPTTAMKEHSSIEFNEPPTLGRRTTLRLDIRDKDHEELRRWWIELWQDEECVLSHRSEDGNKVKFQPMTDSQISLFVNPREGQERVDPFKEFVVRNYNIDPSKSCVRSELVGREDSGLFVGRKSFFNVIALNKNGENVPVTHVCLQSLHPGGESYALFQTNEETETELVFDHDLARVEPGMYKFVVNGVSLIYEGVGPHVMVQKVPPCVGSYTLDPDPIVQGHEVALRVCLYSQENDPVECEDVHVTVNARDLHCLKVDAVWVFEARYTGSFTVTAMGIELQPTEESGEAVIRASGAGVWVVVTPNPMHLNAMARFRLEERNELGQPVSPNYERLVLLCPGGDEIEFEEQEEPEWQFRPEALGPYSIQLYDSEGGRDIMIKNDDEQPTPLQCDKVRKLKVGVAGFVNRMDNLKDVLYNHPVIDREVELVFTKYGRNPTYAPRRGPKKAGKTYLDQDEEDLFIYITSQPETLTPMIDQDSFQKTLRRLARANKTRTLILIHGVSIAQYQAYYGMYNRKIHSDTNSRNFPSGAFLFSSGSSSTPDIRIKRTDFFFPVSAHRIAMDRTWRNRRLAQSRASQIRELAEIMLYIKEEQEKEMMGQPREN